MSSSADELSDAEAGPFSSFPLPSSSDQEATDGQNDREPAFAHSEDDKEEFIRPNRFQGPSSTWHRHAADERALAISLEQQRANDLAVHLYNAHALKSRLHDPALAASAKPWHSKQRWIIRDEDGKPLWHPHPHWTAWPLPATDVPRKGEELGSKPWEDEATWRKAEVYKPSLDLEDELLALMLRKGKERFRRRAWVDGVPEESLEEVSSTEEDVKPMAALPRPPTYSKPDFLADDDEAKAVLQPGIRHIISKLDDLLTGLHKSRAGHRREHTPRSRSSKSAASRSLSRSTAPPRGRSKQSGASAVDDVASGDAEDGEDNQGDAMDESDDESAPPPKRRRSGANNHDLGLRDWSEVLGIASLTGCSPAVVDRAAKRCASLFGENMAFRVMPETAAGEAKDEVVQYVPELVPDAVDSDVDSEDDEDQLESPARQAYFCPYEDCARHEESYELAWRWREHLKRRHKLNPEQIEGIEQRLKRVAGSGAQDVDAGSSERVDDDADSLNTEGDHEMVGGVHADNFLMPLTRLPRGQDAHQRRRRSTDGQTLEEAKRQKRVHEDLQDAEEGAAEWDEAEEAA